MEAIGVRELRQHASRYLARVEAGEELGVTNHGRLIARLVPVSPGERSRQALIDAGIVVPASRSRNLLEATALAPAGPRRNLSEILGEIRDEG